MSEIDDDTIYITIFGQDWVLVKTYALCDGPNWNKPVMAVLALTVIASLLYIVFL